MQVCGRDFHSEVFGRIQAIVDDDPSLARRALSRRVRQWLDWRARNGRLQEMSCRKTLLEPERRGRRARTATLTVRHAPVALRPPQDKSLPHARASP